MPPVDILLAAPADRHQLGILHPDRDYDLIAERTDLRFASEWLAMAGSRSVKPPPISEPNRMKLKANNSDRTCAAHPVPVRT